MSHRPAGNFRNRGAASLMSGDSGHDASRSVSNSGLAVRVDGLAETVNNLSRRVENTATTDDVRQLAIKIDRLSTPPTPQYAVWIAAAAFIVSLMIGFNSLSLTPIKESIDEIKKEAKGSYKEIAADVKEVRTSIVSRGEHEQRWLASGAQMANIQREIDDINKRTAEVYTARDIIIDLRQDVKALKDRVIMYDLSHPPK